MEIDFNQIVFVKVINENQLHVNIDEIGIKLIEFDKMDINGVTYNNSNEFVTVNKLKIQEDIIE